MFKPENIPAELQQLPHWVPWALTPKPGAKKPSKVPLTRHGYPCDAGDPSNWLTFPEAVASAAQLGATGVGFCPKGVTRADGAKLALVDVDELVPAAFAFLDAQGWYIERSPSGKGLRSLCWLPGNCEAVKHAQSYISLYVPGHTTALGELFIHGGYATITGDVIRPGNIGAWPGEGPYVKPASTTVALEGPAPAEAVPFEGAGLEGRLQQLFRGEDVPDRSKYMLPLLATLSWECDAPEQLAARAFATENLHTYFLEHREGDVRRAWTFAQHEAGQAWGMRDEHRPAAVAFTMRAAQRPADDARYLQWLMAAAVAAPEWLVTDMLPRGTGFGATALIVGEANAGKSLFIQTVAAHVACGSTLVLGRYIQPGQDNKRLVVYLTSEDVMGVTWRMQEMAKALGVERVPILVCKTDMVLDADIVRSLRQEIDEACEREGLELAMVVADTYRGLHAGDENDSQEAHAFLTGLHQGLSGPLDALLVTTHHLAKGGGVRGSTALLAFVDVAWEVTGEGETAFVRLNCIKARNASRTKLGCAELQIEATARGAPMLVRPAPPAVEPDEPTPVEDTEQAQFLRELRGQD